MKIDIMCLCYVLYGVYSLENLLIEWSLENDMKNRFSTNFSQLSFNSDVYQSPVIVNGAFNFTIFMSLHYHY